MHIHLYVHTGHTFSLCHFYHKRSSGLNTATIRHGGFFSPLIMSSAWPGHGLQAIQSVPPYQLRVLSPTDAGSGCERLHLSFYLLHRAPPLWSDPSPALHHLRKPLLTQWWRSQALVHHDGFKRAWAKGVISQWQKRPWHILNGEMVDYSALKHMGLCMFSSHPQPKQQRYRQKPCCGQAISSSFTSGSQNMTVGNKWPQKYMAVTKPRRSEQHVPQNFLSSSRWYISPELFREMQAPGLLPGELMLQGMKTRTNR